MKKKIKKLIEEYCIPGETLEQKDLEDLIRRAQELNEGPLKSSVRDKICKKLDIKHSYLKTVMKGMPDIIQKKDKKKDKKKNKKEEKEQHQLSICDGKKCQSSDNACLKKYIEKNYQVKKGGVSKAGNFSYKVCGCLKKCKDGPCVKWDGKVYGQMNPKKLDQLITG